MYLENVKDEYLAALRLGQKEFRELTAAGLDPYPKVLDAILPEGQLTVQELPAQDIPVDRIVGVKTAGRISAFSAGFYPLLDPDSEFAGKWMSLCKAQMSDEGIRDPILCYEYLGDFYVQEGNKRLSVLKSSGAVKISSTVRRMLPRSFDTPQLKAYQEFLEFYKDSKLYDFQFRRPGDYAKLLSFLGKAPGEPWQPEERRNVSAYFHYFREAFDALGGGKNGARPEEALLLWLQLYPFKDLGQMTGKELKKTLSGLWPDVVAGAEENPVKVRTDAPAGGSKSLLGKLITGEHLNVAFVHQRDPVTSTWTRGHDRGRAYLEETLKEKVTVRSYFYADSPEQAEALLDQAAGDGAEVVFTTTPQLLRPTLKAAVKYPKIHFLNCSADSPLSSVRSYYCRIFEGKFITGAIAGALAGNDLVGYVGSYPILGVPASINAFALGAQMTNPRAKIILEWSCLPGDATARLLERGVRVISNRDIPVKDQQYLEYGQYGTFMAEAGGALVPLASPCWLWGKLYENVVRSILAGTWPQKKGAPEALNYWWGMDSGVIDVELTDRVPESLRALARLLAKDMRDGRLDPFRRQVKAQDGTIKNSGETGFLPEDLLHMDWLCENVEGVIPEFDQVLPVSQALVRELGLHREQIPLKKEGPA